MKGYSNIPGLHLTVLRQLAFDYMAKAPKLYFTQMFPDTTIASDEATWEVELTSAGISPFVAPGAPAPRVGIDGHTSGRAKVAYWKEKAYLDESFLNNLRRVGSFEKESAEKQMGRMLQKLVWRSMRRKEWMCAKAIVDGGFTYAAQNGVNFTVSYGRPAVNTLALSEDKKWGTGAQRNPIEDIYMVREHMQTLFGVNVDNMAMTSATLKKLVMDKELQGLLSKSAFGNGDLFARPAQVIGSLFGFGTVQVMDEMYDLNAWVMAVDGTNIVVDNATDFEVGARLMVTKTDERFRSEWRTITAVNKQTNTLTIDAPFQNPPLAGRDKVEMQRKFMDDDTVVFTNPTHEGVPANEFLQAPFGMDGHYGLYTDRKDEWDPDGVYIRVQDKGLPVLYNPQNTFTLKV